MIDAWDVDERGGAPAVEAAVLVLVVGLLIALLVAGGRLVTAEAVVDQAARSAARVASAQRGPAAAQTLAGRTAERVLAQRGLTCSGLRVDVDTAAFGQPLGVTGSVEVRVSCTVPWSDLALPGAPGMQEVRAAFSSPVDAWRERT